MENKETNTFDEWFQQKLTVGRYPIHTELKQYDVIINVSDEYIDSLFDTAMEQNIKYYWFPLNECTSDIGLNSIYGALQILWLAEQRNLSVLLHCHAGVNRSQTVRECYYFLRTGKHFVRPRNNETENKEIEIESIFIFDSEEERKSYRKLVKQNRLFTNIEAGHLPAKYKIETFLKKCAETFLNYEIANGGYLDKIKIETHIN